MPFIDTLILESDAPGLVADAFDVVSLADTHGVPGLTVTSSFGLATDHASLPVSRPMTRLLVCVADHQDPGAVDRVRRALRWEHPVPF